MAETIHIAEMAEKLSKEIFSEFLWQRTGPTNQNWPCEEQEAHGKKTHPSDVVFFYDNPYSLSRTYVNCDLKSYASGSIKAAAIREAMESLAQALNCAEKSKEWQKLYLHEHVNPESAVFSLSITTTENMTRNFTACVWTRTPTLPPFPKNRRSS
jgi:hypothetical protein